MSSSDDEPEMFEMTDPVASLIIQTDGQTYELMLAGSRGIIRRHELFGPFNLNKKKSRDMLKLIFDVAYQTIQDDLLIEVMTE